MVDDNIHVIQNDPLIIVDKFPYTKKKERITGEKEEQKKITKIYFLTHFHADHYTKINKYFHENIFSSTITRKLLINIIGVNEKYIHNLKINKNYYLFNFELIFIDANHCPGSVIIYFGFANGTKIIHTGDFRYSNIHTFLIKKLLSCKRNEKDREKKIEQLKDTKLEEKINKNVLSNELKRYFFWNGEKYNIHFSGGNLNIYKKNTYIVDIEEFRLAYLKNIEDLIWGLKYVEKEFFLYDSIEEENYFNFFIYVELSLYFNQNELDIILLHDNDKMLNDNLVINKENVKNIRFVYGCIREELKDRTSHYNAHNMPILVKKELLNLLDNNFMLQFNSQRGNEFDNTNYEHVKVKNEKDNEINFSQRRTYEHTDVVEKHITKEIKERTKFLTKLEEYESSKKTKVSFGMSESDESPNYIKTIYLDTTYALSKNNLFAPQMYLINFIIYICKRKIREDSAAQGLVVETKNKANVLRAGKRTCMHNCKKEEEEEQIAVTKNEEKKWTTNDEIKNESVGEKDMEEKKTRKEMKSKNKTLFMFGTYNLGKEKIYLSVSEACNMKIHFRNEKKKTIIESFLQNKNMLSRITDNKLEAQIHIVDINYSYIFPKIEKNKFKNLIDEEIEKEFDSFYYIIPTGWVKKYSFYQKNDISIFLIPYSEHSNLSELECFVKSIKPCNIIPTVFSNPQEKLKILNFFNPHLNLQREVYNFLKITDKSCFDKNKKISKQNEKLNNTQKKVQTGKIKVEKIHNDSNQHKLTSFFPFLKRQRR
ncbi:DNA repair metallo-beta-lactamase protein [Plasmodium gonderi]|uniref:DNA repair metallo-beta-lactamase protein n=1 Tax=Plasmodium gonderi TaxID=77519 RepID=A0A1Y1JJM9_PLAGO|nr:DNA repair metallo-beta-lactamase protein [Plasmodium gonderi]GAW82706.1 DNA repair metallo-beta-lactamase protein [Plasmodium gonderi]